VAQPFDFPDTTTTEGAPSLRSLQGWVPRAHIGWALLYELGSRIFGVGSIVPALAENARAGTHSF